MSPVKEEAKRLIDQRPETATWEDVIHTIDVRVQIERGLEDERQGRVYGLDDVDVVHMIGIRTQIERGLEDERQGRAYDLDDVENRILGRLRL